MINDKSNLYIPEYLYYKRTEYFKNENIRKDLNLIDYINFVFEIPINTNLTHILIRHKSLEAKITF